MMDANGKNWVRVTDGPGHDQDPTWAPDNCHLAFVSDRTGTKQIYMVDASTSAPPVRLTTSGKNRMPAWSPLFE